MLQKTFCTITALLISIAAIAQSNFVIYHVNGTVNLLNGNQVSKAERGKSITKNSLLDVKLNSSAMLIDSIGKSLLVNKPGKYSFSNLVQLLKNAGKENVAKEFYAYIYKNFKKDKKPEEQRITAMVQRGHPMMNAPLDSMIITTDEVKFSWTKISKIITARLIIQDHAGTVLLDTTIKNPTSYTAQVGRLLQPGKSYRWKVDEADTNQPSEYFFNFLIAEKKDLTAVQTQQAMIKSVKTLSAKRVMQQEIFEYWLNKYNPNQE
jgi:hypothetical protein